MSNSHGDAQFMHCDGSDPALPGDPWSRLRYHYGQLLGADDFQAEQNGMVLRRRLHNTLLHGLGTVCGLRVSAEPVDPPQSRLIVGEGLAIDVYGREIYVNEPQCLDIIGLHTSDIWETLALSPAATPEDPADEPLSDIRRAYITLCYESCLSNQVPAITPPCGDASEALAFSRVNDRFRIDMVAEAPVDPHPLQRDWWPPGAADSHGDLRARLLDFLLDYPGAGLSLQQLWTATEKAPLLLAVVDLVHEDSATTEITRVEAIDNSTRALLPAVQMTAEQAIRQRLAGADTTPSLKLLSSSDNSETADAATLPEYTLQFSADLEAATVSADSIMVHALEGTGWTPPLASTVTVVGDVVTVALAAAPVADTRLQLHLIGGGPQPVMATTGQPLDGWWDEPISGAGRGRDINVIRVWTLGAA
ncbi:MAG: hypothetical protein LC541_01730 [Candidatus Thiodiazotropha sp.]|nr:hypothetical protein [Candidatus Thiodiazotropha sp.]MCM8920183.1 hypothetical protein [Candidatus Thiodiazotropha sp.]